MIPAIITVIIALTVQAALYGLYLGTFFHCLRWLLYNDGGWNLKKKINWPMLTITVTIFLFSTLNLAVSLPMTLALPLHRSTIRRFDILNFTNAAVQNTTILIVDAVLIYRCWRTYGNSWRIACIPVILWVLCAISSVLIMYVFGLETVKRRSMAKWTRWLWTVFFSGNISLNIYATCAIIYRIVRVAKGKIGGNTGRLYKTCRIVAESGLLYTLSSILNMVAIIVVTSDSARADRVGTITDGINFSLTGISFNLILLRVSQERARWVGDNGESGESKAKPLSTLRFDAAATSSSQEQTTTGTDIEYTDREQ